MATPRPPMVISMAEAEARPTPIVTATEIRQPPTETIWDRASARHQATLTHLAIPRLNSAATTATHPSGRGKLNYVSQWD